MVLFISSYINLTFLFYIIYSLIIITLIYGLTKALYKKYPKISELTIDEYFVMDENYNIQNIFAFITYKLYNKKVLLLHPGDNKFTLANIDQSSLSPIEIEVYNYYKNNSSGKDFNETKVDTSIFYNFYNTTYQELYQKHILKTKSDKIIGKIIFYFGLIMTLMPGILIIMILMYSNINILKMIIGIIISFTTYFLFFKSSVLTNFTPNGSMLYNNFKSFYRKSKKSTSSNSLSRLLIQNHYMYYFTDQNDDDDDDNDDDFDD